MTSKVERIAPAAGVAPASLPYLVTDYDRESGKNELALQNFCQGLTEPRRRWRYRDAGRFHRGNLRFGVALAAGNDGAGVAHAAAGRRGAPGNEADHWLLAAALGLVDEELCGV